MAAYKRDANLQVDEDEKKLLLIEDGLSTTSGESHWKKNNGGMELLAKLSTHSPTPVRDPGCSVQNGKGKILENKQRRQSANVLAFSTGFKESNVCNTKYFIIKSLNHHNIAKSIEKGIWATQAMNEPVLNEAFESADRVLLVFSVNMSGHFQGYAQMTSPIGRRRANVWSEGNEGANPWGGTFSVDWLRLYDLPFQKTVHLKNPLNFFKPVKISRDCQELAQDVGDALCALIDGGADMEGRPKRKVTAADLATFSFKRKRKESVGSLDDRNQVRYHARSRPNGGARIPAVFPRHILQETVHEPFSPPGKRSWVSGGFASELSSHPREAHRVPKSQPRSPQPPLERGLDKEHENGRENRHRECRRPLERNKPKGRTHSSSSGYSADSLVEDDLLNMTYEEYLERHGHSGEFSNGYWQGPGCYFQNLLSPGYGGGWIGRNAGLGHPEDHYSNYVTNWYSRQGGPPMGNSYSVIPPPDAP